MDVVFDVDSDNIVVDVVKIVVDIVVVDFDVVDNVVWMLFLILIVMKLLMLLTL